MSPFQAGADELARRDQRLKVAIDLVGPCTLVPERRSPYEALLSAIVHQQVHGAAAAAILGRLRALYAPGSPWVLEPARRTPAAGRCPVPAELLATPEHVLRGAGLSRSKLLALRDVAARTLDGTVPGLRTLARLDDAAIVERLDGVRGVGRWTAEMLLIFTLGRSDVLPVDDFGVRYGCKLLYRRRALPEPGRLAAFGERWAPWRSVAAWYFWRYLDRLRAEGRDPARRRRRVAAANPPR